ncbi:MAG: hypothetical protein V8T23_14070 [Prevotella sp.]
MEGLHHAGSCALDCEGEGGLEREPSDEIAWNGGERATDLGGDYEERRCLDKRGESRCLGGDYEERRCLDKRGESRCLDEREES